jgi:hypothetical protein
VVQSGALLFVGVLSACGLSNGIEEYVVHFAPGTTEAPARAVGESCPRFGKAFLEPKDKNNLATSRAYPVRYDITNASIKDKNALLDCLKKHSIVRGVSDTNDDS